MVFFKCQNPEAKVRHSCRFNLPLNFHWPLNIPCLLCQCNSDKMHSACGYHPNETSCVWCITCSNTFDMQVTDGQANLACVLMKSSHPPERQGGGQLGEKNDWAEEWRWQLRNFMNYTTCNLRVAAPRQKRWSDQVLMMESNFLNSSSSFCF